MTSRPSDEQIQSSCVQDAGTPTFTLTPSPIPPDASDDEGPLEEADDNILRWYPMRIRFGNTVRALSVRDELQRQGVDNYLHLTEQRVMQDGQLQYKPMPTLCNIIFVECISKTL